MPGAFFHRLWNINNKALVYTVLAISSRIKVSFKIYSSWQFQCTPYMFDLSKNGLRNFQLKNNQIFAKDYWQRLHSSSVLIMTLYDILMVKIHPPMIPLQHFTSRVTASLFLWKWQALFSCPLSLLYVVVLLMFLA